MTTPLSAGTADELLKEQQTEYGRWVAVRAIDIDGARAFNPGDPVPVSHVERDVVSKDDVVGVRTKTAAAVTAAATTEKG